ncbi:hypothetical protein GQ473_02355 [archaeon]|nr:hypothetical protein [archaeon]
MMYITTYTKTITVNNQEWSTDDNARDLIIQGIVSIAPDIKVTSEATPFIVEQQISKF